MLVKRNVKSRVVNTAFAPGKLSDYAPPSMPPIKADNRSMPFANGSDSAEPIFPVKVMAQDSEESHRAWLFPGVGERWVGRRRVRQESHGRS
jgi:hypothetical protein